MQERWSWCLHVVTSYYYILVSDSLLSVYMSKLAQGGSTTIYRFSLNTSILSPWKVCSTERDEVSSFQVWEQTKPFLRSVRGTCRQNNLLLLSEQAFSRPQRNYTSRMTVCVSREYRPYPSWMITSGLCDPRHGWTQEFSFYVAASPQQNSRWNNKSSAQVQTLWRL